MYAVLVLPLFCRYALANDTGTTRHSGNIAAKPAPLRTLPYWPFPSVPRDFPGTTKMLKGLEHGINVLIGDCQGRSKIMSRFARITST